MSHRLIVVLVGAQGDANIGATARAMKNFGATDLRLVQCVPHRTDTAFMWAVDAADVLDRARRFASLDEALADVSTAVAFTRRLGKLRRKRMTIREAVPWILKKTSSGSAALVFGREDAGLSNEEVRRCDAIVTIPSSAKLPSLNLAQAVLIACYELFCPIRARSLPRATSNQRASAETAMACEETFVPRREVARLLRRLGATLDALGYEDVPRDPLRSKILFQLERLFGRGGLTHRDVGMLEGLTSRIRGLRDITGKSKKHRETTPSKK